METAVMDTATAPPVGFIERRRAGSVPPRGTGFVERRRPAPILVAEVEDLHDGDLHGVLADGLDYGLDYGLASSGDDAGAAAVRLAGLIGPAAFAAHDLRAAAAELLG
jgi:hypothetical protein